MSLLSPTRISSGKTLFRVNSKQKHKVGGLAYAGLDGSYLKIKLNNLHNVPKTGGHPMEWFNLEDGIDNLNNPGNRSKHFSSVNFLDPNYWN